MRWLNWAKLSRLPRDMRQRLELLGRHQLDQPGSGIDSGHVYTVCIEPFRQYTDTDQEGFLTDLHALVAGDGGGFATFGAACLTWELHGRNALEMPAAWPLTDAGIDFKLARGLPPGMFLTGYEKQRQSRRGAPTG